MEITRDMGHANGQQRIAYLTGEYPAVSHTFILREVEALRAQGLEVLTCSVRRGNPKHLLGPAEKDAASTTFYLLDAAKNPLTLLGAHLAALASPRRYLATLALALRTRRPGARGLLWQLFYFLEAGVLARHLSGNGVTQLHSHFANSSASVAMLTAELANIPFSYTLHGPADLFEPYSWHLAEKTARARFVACISYFARSQCMLFSDPVHWPKLRIIHCGITPELYQDSGATQSGRSHFVFVGRLAAVKGIRVLLQAFQMARKTNPDLTLTLVGDGPDRAALEAEAAPMGDVVRFAGFQSQSEVAKILATADVFVLPSFAEGVPVVLMEAMASGKPVLASRVAGVPELVEDGVNGFLVAPGDAVDLAKKIGIMSADAALRMRMGQAGRQKVQEEFNIETEATRLRALFEGDDNSAIRPSL